MPESGKMIITVTRMPDDHIAIEYTGAANSSNVDECMFHEALLNIVREIEERARNRGHESCAKKHNRMHWEYLKARYPGEIFQ